MKMKNEKTLGIGVSNLYIQDAAKTFCSDDFAGVFSSDAIPESLHKRERFNAVCNLSRLGEEGTHFVTLVGRPAAVLYIDTFGLPCHNDDIGQFLQRCGRPVLFNFRRIQSTTSAHCGLFALMYVMFYDRRREAEHPNARLNFSRRDLNDNDQKCFQYISQMIAQKK
jgi:hypothetical protein